MARTWIRSLALVAAVVSLGAAPAQAQLMSYTTNGVFGGALCGGAPGSCNIGNTTLTFVGASPSYLGGNTSADFGTFLLGSTGGTVDYTGMSFTLTITQSSPTPGSSVLVGSIGGTLTYSAGTGAASGGLFWMPEVQNFSIGDVNYRLYVDDNGRFAIASPSGAVCTPGIGCANPNASTLRGSITTTPEPGTVVLLGTGIAGLGLFGLRRRQNGAA